MVVGGIERQSLQAQSIGVLDVRTGLPNRRVVTSVVIFLGARPGGVFIGELEKTITQRRIGGIAGETAATLGLLAKVKRLRHRTLSQRDGGPFGALSRRRLSTVAANIRTVPSLCPVGDSIPRLAPAAGTRIGSRERYIEPGIIFAGVVT